MYIELSPKEYETRLNWNDAKLYCDLLNIDGKMDWRLPTIRELSEISDNPTFLDDTCYWSSDHYNDGLACLFYPVKKTEYYNNNNLKYHVRPIRTVE